MILADKSKQVVIGSEVTYLHPELGGRLCELAMIELLDGVPTGKYFQSYFNPQAPLPFFISETIDLSSDFLETCPLFEERVIEILDFIDGAELIINHAVFDIPFLDFEISHSAFEYGPLRLKHKIIDTLSVSRVLMPEINSAEAYEMFYEKTNIFNMKTGAVEDANQTLYFYLGINKLVKKYDF